MLDRLYYILRHRESGEILRAQGRAGELADKPALYISQRRAKQARNHRTADIADPEEWEVVPVRVIECVEALAEQ